MAIPAPPPGFTEDVDVPQAKPQQALPAAPEGFTEDVDPTGQSYLAGLARAGLGQGMALGFGDEILAGLRTLGGESYADAVRDERAKMEAFRKVNPKAALAAEILGSIATPGLGVAGGAVKSAATIGGRIGQGIKIGAGYGLLSGIGTSEVVGNEKTTEENLKNLAKSAGTGAAVGGILGGALPVVGGLAGGVVERVREAISPTLARRSGGIDAAADQVLANRIKRAGKAPQDLLSDLESGKTAAQLPKSTALMPETIMDTDPSLQRLGGSVFRSGNEAGNTMQEFVASRQGGEPTKGLFGKQSSRAVPQNQYERIVDDFQRAFGVKSKNAAREVTTIRNEQKVLGNADYKKAWDSQQEFDLAPTLVSWELMKKNEVGGAEQSALSRAIKLFTRPDPNNAQMMRLYAAADDAEAKLARAIETGKLDVAEKLQRNVDILNKQLEEAHIKIGNAPFPVNNLERFDRAKRSFDGMIADTKNPNVKRLLVQFKNDLLDAAHGGDRNNPAINQAYSEAREAWGNKAALLEAAEMGKKYLRGSDVSSEDFKALSKAEKNMFLLMVSEDIKAMLGSKSLGPTADFTKGLYKPSVFGKLREIVPQGKTSEQLGELIRREGRMSETAAEVLGNSKTAQRTQDDLEFASRDMLGAAYNAFRSSGGVINLGIDALKVGFERAFGFRDDMALALAKRLTEVDPAEQAQILSRVAQRMGPDKVDKFLQFLERARVVGTAAASAEISKAAGALQQR